MSKLTKIAQGHYRNEKGEVRCVASSSGAPHTRSKHAKWMVIRPGRRSEVVGTLATARLLLA